jgi:hypothetical protein
MVGWISLLQMADVRQLFKQAREQRQQTPNVTLSEYASRNAMGQLVCTLCRVTVKKDALWQAHSMTKKHLDSLAALKSKIASAPRVSTPVDSHATESDSENDDDGKSALPQDFFDKPATAAKVAKKPALSADFFDNTAEGERVVSILKAKEIKTVDADIVAAEILIDKSAQDLAFEKEFEVRR